jgi:transcriptional regulator with XRE-family HTH domain
MGKITSLSKDPAGIAGRMHWARVGRDISLENLSEMSGVHIRALFSIENAQPGYSLHDLNRARKVLGLSLSYVMDGEEVAP